MRNKVLLRPTFSLLAAESLARADPLYRSPAQLCLPASVGLFIPGFTCVFVWMVVILHRVRVYAQPLSLHCHLSTREAFPEHTANKVGQVRGSALFLSESNFQEVPTGKRVPAPETKEP